MAYQGGGGSLKSTSINGVKMYSVTAQNRSLATWLNPKKLRALRKDKDYLQRVDLIQDLRFETATTKIKATPDGEFLIASGIYPPQVKVYELRELSLKFERHLVSEIINFEVLGDDYSKIAFLCADRSVRLHAKYGSHYSLRIPRMGRDIAYDCWSCDLICAASSPDLYRINLEQGRFLSSLGTQSPALNVVCRSKVHGLVACGGEDGYVECFDMRTRSSVGRINAAAPAGDIGQEVTAIQFDGDGGYFMAVGSSAGKVLIYDMRSSCPLRVKDHMYGSPILNIKWHQTLNSERPKLITSDKHIVRIWDPETGDGMTSIEPAAGNINDLCVFSESGLMLLALDSSQIPSYFIPALGPAPKWCSYLENLTEELEEGGQTTIYDDFKFLTKEDLERLNLTNLIGTNLLRAYMHGFFIDYRLYKKAQALADPFAYDTYIERRKQEKLQAERESRITIKRKLPKVNRVLAARLLENEEAETVNNDTVDADTKKKSKKKKGLTSEVMKDERFEALFKNEDFEVDEFSREYLALHPLAPSTQPSLVEEHFEPVMEDEDQSLSDSDAPAAPESSDDEHAKGRSNSEKKSRVPRLYEVKDERHAEAFWNRVSLAKEDALTLGERVGALTNRHQDSHRWNNVKSGPGGSREISFIPRSSAKYMEDDEDMETHREKRRGVQSLKMKPDGYILVFTIAACFLAELGNAKPNASEVLYGLFVPQLKGSGSTLLAISLLGAMVMPHNLFLHSALVLSRKIPRSVNGIKEACRFYTIESGFALVVAFLINVSVIAVSGSVCNCSNINPDDQKSCQNLDLNKASFLLKNVLGSWSSKLFAIALLASGQSSTITGTYAGQYVMQGFLDLRLKPWIRNFLTRCLAIVPSLVVALIGGSAGAGKLIIIASMILSFELPFALVPLLKFTSSKTKMGLYANSIAISATTWTIGSLIMGINIYFLVDHLIELLIHSHLKLVGKVLCGILGFSGTLVYLAGIAYLVLRKNKGASHLIALTTPESRQMDSCLSCNASVYSLPREDIVSMQLPHRTSTDVD